MTSQGAKNRRNGRDYEAKVRRELAQSLAEAGLDPYVAVEQKNRSGYDGDDVRIVIHDHVNDYVAISVECKNVQAMKLAEWVDQAIENAGDREVPTVIHRRRGKAPVEEHYLTMRVQDFVDIIRACLL